MNILVLEVLFLVINKKLPQNFFGKIIVDLKKFINLKTAWKRFLKLFNFFKWEVKKDVNITLIVTKTLGQSFWVGVGSEIVNESYLTFHMELRRFFSEII